MVFALYPGSPTKFVSARAMSANMRPEPNNDRLEMENALLARFSRGEIDRLAAMRRLDMSYSELLELLHLRGLDLPAVSDADGKRMSAILNSVLDDAAR